jgi:hypothetical protein
MSHTPLLGPLDGKDNDTPVVEVIHGESCVAKQIVFSMRRASLGILRGYACGQELRSSRVFVAQNLSTHRHGILRPPHSCPVHRGLSHTQI